MRACFHGLEGVQNRRVVAIEEAAYLRRALVEGLVRQVHGGLPGPGIFPGALRAPHVLDRYASLGGDRISDGAYARAGRLSEQVVSFHVCSSSICRPAAFLLALVEVEELGGHDWRSVNSGVSAPETCCSRRLMSATN